MSIPPPRHPIRDRPSLERYVLESCRQLGLNGPEVWKAIRSRKPAGLFILAQLGVDQDLVAVRHRPRNVGGAYRYEETVRRHIEAGQTEAVAITLAATEHGVKPDSVRRSRERNPNIVADRWFERR